MCSKPSMPPRSTKAPKSAMFLTTPDADLANFQLFQQFLLGILAFFFDQAAAADDNVPTLFVDLQDFTLHRPVR